MYVQCTLYNVTTDQLYMAVCFWYLVKRDLSSVCYSIQKCTLASLFTRYRNNTQCLSGRVVGKAAVREDEGGVKNEGVELDEGGVKNEGVELEQGEGGEGWEWRREGDNELDFSLPPKEYNKALQVKNLKDIKESFLETFFFEAI